MSETAVSSVQRRLRQTPRLDKGAWHERLYNALAETSFYGIFCNCMIEVRHLSGDQYEVRVTDETPTTHHVTLKEADRIRLGGTDVPGDALIAESFRFLLEREPNTSILRTFDLPVIGTYFPEYERDIRKRVAQS